MTPTENNVFIPPMALTWLRVGQRGISSEAIFSHLTGVRVHREWFWYEVPFDSADFRRCQLLLEMVPEFQARFHEMKTVSPYWAMLVDEWPRLVAIFDTACPAWRETGGYSSALDQRLQDIRIQTKPEAPQ